MMNYDYFKEIVKEEIRYYLPEEYKDYLVVIEQDVESDQVFDKMYLKPVGRTLSVTPVVYINSMYADYLQGLDFAHTMTIAGKLLTNGLQKSNQLQIDTTFADAKDRIVMELVNTELNKDMLKKMPHREFLDLSIIYRYVPDVEMELCPTISVISVNNQLQKIFNMTEDQLYKAAIKNTPHILPLSCRSLDGLLHEFLIADGMPKEIADAFLGEIPDNYRAYVITNDSKAFGAVAMICDEELKKLSKKLDSDLYIIPSSVHEIIALPTSALSEEELKEAALELDGVIKHTNATVVESMDWLSDHLYFYDKHSHELSIVFTELDKMVDEKQTEEDELSLI